VRASAIPVLDDLDRRLAREIARLRARYQLSLDEFRGLYVSDEHVDGLIARSDAATAAPAADIARPAAALSAHDRWTHLVSRFGLSATEEDLLLLAVAPELDLKYETVFAYLNDDVTRKWPTADLAARVLGPDADRAEVLGALGPASTLRRERLLEVIEPPSARPSLLNSGFAARPAVSRFVQGIPIAEADREEDARPEHDHWHVVPCSADRIRELRRLARLVVRRNGDAPAIVIVGPAGSGRMHVARALAAEMGLPLRRTDVRAVQRAGISIAIALRDLALERRLEPAAVCVHGLAALTDGDGRLPSEHTGLLAEIPASDGPVLILARPDTSWRELLAPRRAVLVELGVPPYPQRRELWRAHLERAGVDIGDAASAALADRFAFTPAEIARSIEAARDRQALDDGNTPVSAAALSEAARAEPRDRLGSLAVITPCPHGWNDLILPPPVIGRLKDIAAAIDLRHVVYGDWGFSRRITTGIGVKALFAGPSGTGKTMAAGVIAREVGLDLVKVDLSGLVSKFIGETEKNLDRVFSSARAGNALLFFDEADAIFGKRSEVKDAHDRYANIEVAYLLQKLEEHDGVVVLATNIRRNIDEAFSRRLHYVVDFPQPDAVDRERLWRGSFPAEAPVDPAVDFAFLARQFDLCGGDIRNVVLEAAFLAAHEPAAIGMSQLVRALAQQLSKQGRTPGAAEFQRYYPLVNSADAVAAGR